MTISSIHSNPSGTGMVNEFSAPEMLGKATNRTSANDTLQEVTDQAKLSALAPKIQAMFSKGAGAGNNVLETLSANVEKLQDGFVDALYATFSGENINLAEKMTLRLDENNMLTVAGDHPEKSRVDAILNDNPALSAAFGEIASQSEVLRDITNINKIMTRQTGMEAYATNSDAGASNAVYQMSLKGEMSHFYFARS